jgi:hypothetical protein
MVLTFAVALRGPVLAMTVLAVKLAPEAGGASALGSQVVLQARDVISQARDIILQAQDAQGRSQAVALVDQFSDAAGEGPGWAVAAFGARDGWSSR